MNNFEKIKQLTFDEFATLLFECCVRPSLWETWFSEQYCDKCEPCIINAYEAKDKLGITILNTDATVKCAFCELAYKCKFFPEKNGVPTDKEVISMWLEAEAADEVII